MDMTQTPSQKVNPSQLRTAPRTHCALCGSEGEVVHERLTDRLFGAPGQWTFKRCIRRECGLMWLDPMPLTEDIGLAYANYYTHAAPGPLRRAGLCRWVYAWMKQSYWTCKYGYALAAGVPVLANAAAGLLYLFPIRRQEADADIRFLPGVARGRLLDVGCGAGDWLMTMRGLGWEVEGVDFDDQAVALGRRRGVNVRSGSLEQQQFAADSFDAVTLNHVIEHVPDPVATLSECRRVLKPGGTLSLATPNSLSLGHRLFGADWRGLEPPRHLHIFSTVAIARLLERAGFSRFSVTPQVSVSVMYKTLLLRQGRGPVGNSGRRQWPTWPLAKVLNSLEYGLTRLDARQAECVAAIAVKE